MTASRPLLDHVPGLELPWANLGAFPTPIEPATDIIREDSGLQLYIKRDDLSSTHYGGNKVRTLEVLFADALQRGDRTIYSTGAYGSNHGLATVIHAPRAGLEPGIMLFPQPYSATAADNLVAMLSHCDRVVDLWHWSSLPLAMWRTARKEPDTTVMEPGGATPLGALGYVSAAFELGRQVQEGLLPPPDLIVLAVGSTCTSAGLLLGTELAANAGVGFVAKDGSPAPPSILAVRVTPWPVTAHFRIVSLARRAAVLLADRSGGNALPVTRKELARRLTVSGKYLGGGYGKPTEGGYRAIQTFARHDQLALDTTYSGKSGAAILDLIQQDLIEQNPAQNVVYWATKSTAPLPPTDLTRIEDAPVRMRRWLASG